MRIAFYAPLKSPDHEVPSGDRRVGRLLFDALVKAGHEVKLASISRTYDASGSVARQAQIRDAALNEAGELLARWRARGEPLPDLWFTYHLYYKAPDWLGPAICKSLGIPYVVAEASYASKRANGPWAIGHQAVVDAIRSAALVLCPTKDDVAGIATLEGVSRKAVWFPPFLDTGLYKSASKRRSGIRKKFAELHRLDPSAPWIGVVAMMRPGDKLDSYRMLAATLERMSDLPWQVVIGGNGVARPEVENAVTRSAHGRARFLGELDEPQVAELYAACDLSMWPAINEAYGMSMLEAQAAGIPVVSRAVRGVPDVVNHGETGLLASPGNDDQFTEFARLLLQDHQLRGRMGVAAGEFTRTERNLPTAAARLRELLRRTYAST